MRILLVEDETKVSTFVARGLMEERFAHPKIMKLRGDLQDLTTDPR